LSLPLDADDAAGHGDLIVDHDIEPGAVLMGPDGSDRTPDVIPLA
jgi:hypothetical protein